MSPRVAQNPGALRGTLATGHATKWKGSRRTIEFFREVTGRNETGCWVWPGYLDKGGYGKARFSHPEVKKEFVHRVAWSVANGRAIPEGMTVDHLCYNTACCNPDHLRLLTPSENSSRTRQALSPTCRNGHAYTPETTRIRVGKGTRVCQTCAKQRALEFYARSKAMAS